ncbi:MAG: hypothetical protein ACOCWW_01835 [Bacteroidota bacterium]
MKKCYYDFYLNGFENAQKFAYIPDFEDDENNIWAYTNGYSDGIRGKDKLSIEEFENKFESIFNQ